MTDPSDAASQVTPEEFRALLKIAGISVSEDQAPLVLSELNAQLGLAQTMEGVLDNPAAPDFAPYDPTFPNIDLEDDAE